MDEALRNDLGRKPWQLARHAEVTMAERIKIKQQGGAGSHFTKNPVSAGAKQESWRRWHTIDAKRRPMAGLEKRYDLIITSSLPAKPPNPRRWRSGFGWDEPGLLDRIELESRSSLIFEIRSSIA
jgi:hypothetical protein